MFNGNLIASELVSRARKILEPKIEFQGSRDNNDLQLIITDIDLALNPLDMCGLKNRKGEEYSIGDLLLLLLLKKEEYTYSFVTSKGFKYINVLERGKIINIIDSPDFVNTSLASSIIKVRNLKVEEEVKAEEAKDFGFSMTVFDKLNFEFGPIDAKLLKIAASSDEIRPLTRNSMLMSCKRGFENILERSKVLSHSSHNDGSLQKSKKKAMRVIDEIYFKYKKRPVIIVPSGVNIVCKNNIKSLLEDSKYIDPSTLSSSVDTSSSQSSSVDLIHKIGGKPIRFRIIENSYVSRMSPADWVNIVCVIINPKGGRWQFKGYPFESIVNLFSTLKGVLFVHDTDAISDEFTHWDIKICRISRVHQHKNACVTNDFWQYIETFLLEPRKKFIHSTKTL